MTMRLMKRALIALFLLLATTAAAQERDMERINWMEFREVVPSKIRTVLLPTGTLEPTLRSPDHRPFWMSTGPDGRYETHDDNIYSFGN